MPDRVYRIPDSFSCPRMRPRHSEVRPVAAEGDTSQEVPRRPEKTHVAPSATHLQLRIGEWNCGGLSNVTMAMCKDL